MVFCQLEAPKEVWFKAQQYRLTLPKRVCFVYSLCACTDVDIQK